MAKAARVSRLLEIVSLLQSGTGWTAQALAARFGVSPTRVFHDIRALRGAGVPVRRSRHGYSIDPSFFLPSVRLTPQELLLLLFPAEVFAGAETDAVALRAARSKLLVCLPEPLRATAQELLARTSVRLPTGGVDARVLAEVRAAVAERRRVAITYTSARTARRRLEVHPYGLAYRKHAWYLVAHSLAHGEVRKFRVSRIAAVERTGLHFTVPQDFSLEDVFAGSWYVFGGEPQEIGVRLSPRVARLVAERVAHPGERLHVLDDGWTFYTARVRNLDEVAWWLVQYGGEAVVAYPPALRQKVISLAEGVLRAHGVPGLEAPRPYRQAGADVMPLVGESAERRG